MAGIGIQPSVGEATRADEAYVVAALRLLRSIDPFFLQIPDNFPHYTAAEIRNWIDTNIPHEHQNLLDNNTIDEAARLIRKDVRSWLHRVEWRVKGVHIGWQEERAFRQRFLQVDTGWATTDEEQQARVENGPAWYKNSCAVDTICKLALSLDVGITRLDQAKLLQLDGTPMPLSELTQSIYRFVRQDWGDNAKTNRSIMSAMRNEVLNAYLEEHNRQKDVKSRLKLGDFVSVTDVASRVFAGVPQFTWNQLRATICTVCREIPNGQTTLKSSPSHSRSFLLLMPGASSGETDTVPRKIQDYFNSLDLRRPSEKACHNCGNDALQLTRLIGGELPARLMVEPSVDMMAQDKSTWDPFVIYYNATNADGAAVVKTANYQLVAIVHFYGAHFWLSARPMRMRAANSNKNEWITYDGMQSGAQPIVTLHQNLKVIRDMRVSEQTTKRRTTQERLDNRRIVLVVYERCTL